MFYLVESRTCPDNPEGFKEELQDGETFETNFIGDSVQDCQNWVLQNQVQQKFIEQDFIAIADARSATDSTLLVKVYGRELNSEEPVEFELNTWVDWRIEPQGAGQIWTSLFFGALEVTIRSTWDEKRSSRMRMAFSMFSRPIVLFEVKRLLMRLRFDRYHGGLGFWRVLLRGE